MRICIYGAGAIGGYLGVQLCVAGQEVTLIARGPHLQAIRDRGLALDIGGERRVVRPVAIEDPAEAGPQDYVVLAVKAHAVPKVVARLQPLLEDETAVVTAQNGIPWWYFYRLDGQWRDRHVESVDPGGRIGDAVGPERVIGCVAYPACEIAEPGVIRHVEGDRFSLGEPDGSKSERVRRLADAFITAGLRAPVRSNLRNEIWVKLWGNVAFNPISALTRATLGVICADRGTRALVREMMVEAEAVAARLGERFGIDVDARIAGAEKVGAHRTSMLQDLERGRPMEVDAIVGAVAELGRLTGTPTPSIDAIYALVRLLAREAGCLPD